MKRFKQYFKGWGFNLQGAQKERKGEILNDLICLEAEETVPLSYEKLCYRTQINSELLKILDEEELYWFKRSHENWLHKGDNNTKYFHRIANGRKRKKTIFSLQDEGQTIEGDQNLLEHATNYYKNLFGPAGSNRLKLSPNLFENNRKLSPTDNEELCKPFSEIEIKDALFQMEHNKAAGPDKIPIEFFQKCWDIVRMDIIDLFEDFH